MNSSINLVSIKNEALERQHKLLFVLRVSAVVLLTSIALISIIAFIITTQIPISQVKSEEASTLSSITSMSKKVSSYYLIKDRISNINSLMNKRSDFTTALDLIFSKVSDTLSVDSLSIEGNELEITLSSSNLSDINDTVNQLAQIGNTRTLKNIKLKSLTLNASSGKYAASFTGDLF